MAIGEDQRMFMVAAHKNTPGISEAGRFRQAFRDGTGFMPGLLNKSALSENHAEQLLKKYAAKIKLKDPSEIFSLELKDRIRILNHFCRLSKTSTFNFQDGQIADAIIKWRYPGRLASYVDTSKGQAASAIVLGITSKVNLFEMLNGGPIVENGMIMNGMFGRMTTNYMNVSDTVADILYLSKHALEEELPQPAFILFQGRYAAGGNFEEEKAQLVKARSDFEDEMSSLLAGTHRIRVADPHHQTSIKFRLLCTVWNEETGQLMVVSDKPNTKPVRFVDWADKTSNIRDVISADEAELKGIIDFVEKEGLINKLKSPQNKSADYRPWSDLVKKVTEELSADKQATSQEIYVRAVKIWRYALLQIAVENVASYEAQWPEIKLLSNILNSSTKLSCNDGRQSGNVRVLGGIVSDEEFKALFSESNLKMETLRFTPHYNCGFLSACHEIHLVIDRLSKIIEQTGDPMEKEILKDFYRVHMRRFAREDKSLPVPILNFERYLTEELKQELSAYLKGEGALNDENRKFIKSLYAIFLDPDEKYRRIIRRGIKTKVFKPNPSSGFVEMTAAKTVYRSLEAHLGDNYRDETGKNGLSKRQINALVIEEVARNTFDRYVKLVRAFDTKKQFKIEFFMDNFETGQATAVPDQPQSKFELMNLKRDDYYLKKKFTPHEVIVLGLSKYAQWEIRAAA